MLFLLLAAMTPAQATGLPAPIEGLVLGSTQVSEPEVGSVSDVSVGEQMLLQRTAARLRGVVFRAPFKAVFDFLPGFYLATREDEKYIYLTANERDARPGYGSVLPKIVIGIDMAEFAVAFKVRKGEQRVCFGGNCTNADFVADEKTQYADNAFQQTLVYNGGSGDHIKIAYREFKDDMARAPFSNEIEYDLSKSKIIAYKHARIEVIQADNTHIKYRVLSNFN